MKKFLVILFFIPIFIWGIWIAIPESTIQYEIESSIADENFSLETDGLKKRSFYKIEIDRLKLKFYDTELVSFKDIQAPINLLALLSLKLKVSFNGDIGKGTVLGNIFRTTKEKKLEMKVKNASINEISFLTHAGIDASGTLSGNITMINDEIHVEFETHNADFQPVVFSGITLPLNFFNSVKGALEIKRDTIHVSSLALKGKDIYARLKGKIINNLMDLSIEIMPGSSFLDNPIFVNALKQYKISPGYYVIHIRRNIHV